MEEEPQLYKNVTNGGYKCALDVGLQLVIGFFAKESPSPSFCTPFSKFSRPVVLEQGFGSSKGIYSSRGPIATDEPAKIVQIATLNPYQGRWTIKARVATKSELGRFHNANGKGKVFHFDVLDAGGEIRVTCFNAVADRLYGRIEQGKVYLISKGSLKPAAKSFNHLKNEWEIFLENWSTVEPCFEEDFSIPHQRFDFRPISEIENMEENEMVDIIGIVLTIRQMTTIMRKNGTQVQRRSLQLLDMSGRSVDVTMWGIFCANEGQQLQDLLDSGHFPVLAVKAGRLSDFGGKRVGTISSSQLLVNPALPQAFQVKDWFEQVGMTRAQQSLSREGADGTRIDMRKTLAQIKAEGLGRSEKPDWISMKATISLVRSNNFCYTACPLSVGDRQCNKKVINTGDGAWRCNRCDKIIAECDYRYLLSLQVQDHTGVNWITAFDEAGEGLMGISAKDLYMWKQNENPMYEELIRGLFFSKHLFRLKVKEENYNDEQRVKCTVVKSERLNYAAESRVLIDLIEKLFGGEQTSGINFNPPGNSGYGDCARYVVARAGQVGALGGGSYGETMYSGSVQNAFGEGYANEFANGYNGGISCFRHGGAHMARDFPDEAVMSRNHGNFARFNGGSPMANTNACYKCEQGGHWARDCHGQVGTGGSGRKLSYGGYDKNARYACRGY